MFIKKKKVPEGHVAASLKRRMEYKEAEADFQYDASMPASEKNSLYDTGSKAGLEFQVPAMEGYGTLDCKSCQDLEASISYDVEAEVIKTVRNKMKKLFGNRIEERDTTEFKSDIWYAINEALMDEAHLVPTEQERERLQLRIYHLITGQGPLELLFHEGYSEIMVTRYDRIFVEDHGKMKLTEVQFGSEEELRTIVEQMLAPLGRQISTSRPMVDGRLSDGSRINVVIPPIAVDGIQLTIRRFPERVITEEDYLKFGSLNKEVLEFLKYAVKAKWNIVVSGGTGSGKTSLLNLLSNFLDYDPGLSVVTIEDSCELKINHPNVRRYETRSANQSGEGRVTSRDMVKNALRVRPDVVIIGEIRDGTMADYLRMATSGHDGCLTTLHSNSPKEVEDTVLILFQMAEDYNFTETAIRRLYGAAVDLIVQIKRCSDNVRRITNVSHVAGYGKTGAGELGITSSMPEYDPDECYVKDIFRWEQWGMEDGRFIGDYLPTGYIPKRLIEKAKDRGIEIPESLFRRCEKNLSRNEEVTDL